MHELSIALSLIDVAANEAKLQNARVTAVHLRLGLLSGVVPEALQSAYEIARIGTVLADSKLLIEPVAVRIFCPRCLDARDVVSVQQLQCVECGSPASELIHGREMEVFALDVDDSSRDP